MFRRPIILLRSSVCFQSYFVNIPQLVVDLVKPPVPSSNLIRHLHIRLPKPVGSIWTKAVSSIKPAVDLAPQDRLERRRAPDGVNMRRTGPIILPILSIPACEADAGQPAEQRLDLSFRQAAHADVDGGCIGLTANGHIRVMNVASARRMVNALSDPVNQREAGQSGMGIGMKSRGSGRIQCAPCFRAPGIVRTLLWACPNKGDHDYRESVRHLQGVVTMGAGQVSAAFLSPTHSCAVTSRWPVTG